VSREVEKLGKRIAQLEETLNALLRNGVGLGHSSFEDGTLSQYTNGSLGSSFGTQFDGTNGVYPVTGPAPPAPAWTDNFGLGEAVQGVVGGILIRWEGVFEGGEGVVAPMDFKQVEFYVSDTATPSLLYPYLKNFITSARGGEVLLSIPPSDTGYYVWMVTRSLAGSVSSFSPILGPIFPQKIREEDLGFSLADLQGSTIFWGPDAPVTDKIGDLWLDLPDEVAYRWEGATSGWVESLDQTSVVAAMKEFIGGQLGSPSSSMVNTADALTRTITSGSLSPHSIIASDVLATGTVTAALLEAVLILGTTILAGNPDGTHTKIRPDGVYVYSEDPVDGVPNEVIRMGTSTNDFFGITDGQGLLQLSLDMTGGVNARTANFREDIVVAGRTLTSVLRDIPGGGRAGSGARNRTAWASAFVDGITTEYGLIEASFILEVGRIYKITPFLYWTRSANTTYLEVHVRDGGSGNPTITSPILCGWFATGGDNAAWTLPFSEPRTFEVTSSGAHRLLLTVKTGGGGSVNINDVWGQAPQMLIEDLGPSSGNPASINTGGGSLGGGTPQPPPPPPPQQYFTEIGTDNRGTYRGNSTQRGDTGDVIQGWDPSGFNGDGYGWFGFGNLPNIYGHVDRVDLYIYWNHWYYNSGGTAIISPIMAGNGAALNSLKLRNDWYVPGWPKPGGVWVTVPNDWWSLFAATSSPRAYGIGLGPSGGTNETYYGRASDCRLRIWYTQ
jgi:hypothetical protein